MLTALLSIIPSIIKRVLPADPEKAMELQNEITKELLKHESLQIEVNREEAKHESLFVAGWRPAVAWAGVFGFVYSILLQPIVNYFLTLKGLPLLPHLDTDTMNTMLFGLLGLGGYRTLEKIKKWDRK